MDMWGELIALGIDAIIFGFCARVYLNSSWCIGLVEVYNIEYFDLFIFNYQSASSYF